MAFFGALEIQTLSFPSQPLARVEHIVSSKSATCFRTKRTQSGTKPSICQWRTTLISCGICSATWQHPTTSRRCFPLLGAAALMSSTAKMLLSRRMMKYVIGHSSWKKCAANPAAPRECFLVSPCCPRPQAKPRARHLKTMHRAERL